MKTFLKSLAASLAVATLSAAPAVADTVTYFHNDLVGSPMASTNQAGQVVWRETYRPYGDRQRLEPASSANEIWFTSRKEDPRTELIYMGARYYDPRIGRFLSPDPVGFIASNIHSFNRYAYANNNPYRYKDPDGRVAVQVGLATGLTVLGIGAASSMTPAQVQSAARGLADFITSGSILNPAPLIWGLIFNEKADPDPSSANDKDPADKSGELTKAGRAQQKHGDREGSAFDPAKGTPEDKNRQGQETVCCIVNSPTRTDEPNQRGGTDVRERPDGRGARFDRDGRFTGFIEPRGQ